MSVRVDYRCTGCRGVCVLWVDPPVADRSVCPACGEESSVLLRAGTTLLQPSRESRPGRPADVGAARSPQAQSPACRELAWLPGSCHMVPTAARRLAATLKGDTRAVDREITVQETAIARGLLGIGSAFVHHEGEGHRHRNG